MVQFHGKQFEVRGLQRGRDWSRTIGGHRGKIRQLSLGSLDRHFPNRGQADEEFIRWVFYRLARFLAERLRLVFEPDERVGVEEVAGHVGSYSLGSS